MGYVPMQKVERWQNTLGQEKKLRRHDGGLYLLPIKISETTGTTGAPSGNSRKEEIAFSLAPPDYDQGTCTWTKGTIWRPVVVVFKMFVGRGYERDCTSQRRIL